MISLIIAVVVVGILLLLAQKVLDLIPMDPGFRQIAWILIILVAVLAILSVAFPGVLGHYGVTL